MANKIKKGDTVQVISGEQKGKTGRVMRVIPEKDRVLIEGVNLALKHVRPSQKNPQGGRIRVEQPIHISNVMPVGTKSNKGTRVRFEVGNDGTKKRIGADGSDLGVVTKGGKK